MNKTKGSNRGKILAIIIMLVVIRFILSCSSSSKTTTEKWNLSSIYNPSKSTLHPSYKIFHNSQNTSLLYLKVYISELFFQPVGEKGASVSEVGIEYALNETDGKSLVLADTGHYNYTIQKEGAGQFFLSQIPIKAETGKSYRLKVIMRDKLRKNFNLSFLEVEKRPETGEQFFNITNIERIPVFKNIVTGNNAIRIYHASPASGKLFISYYKNNDTPYPKPTYAVVDDPYVYNRYDTLYVVDYSQNTALSLAYEGLYYIQFDTLSDEGVSITKFNEGFPKVVTAEELVPPLSYITTTPEFNRLMTSTNKKIAADKFWIKAAGNTDRAREMIRIYYNRVYYANYYFTNTKPGWKTDRGMVYIIYGAPHNLKKTPDSEIWYYYIKNNTETISFTFDYKPTKFGLNQYTLERSENHAWHWQEAIYSWTNGKIYLLD